MVSFCDLYDYLCSDIIFDLISFMNMKQKLLKQVDIRFEHDESNADQGH